MGSILKVFFRIYNQIQTISEMFKRILNYKIIVNILRQHTNQKFAIFFMISKRVIRLGIQ